VVNGQWNDPSSMERFSGFCRRNNKDNAEVQQQQQQQH
jgi:hypothetical protein